MFRSFFWLIHHQFFWFPLIHSPVSDIAAPGAFGSLWLSEDGALGPLTRITQFWVNLCCAAPLLDVGAAFRRDIEIQSSFTICHVLSFE